MTWNVTKARLQPATRPAHACIHMHTRLQSYGHTPTTTPARAYSPVSTRLQPCQHTPATLSAHACNPAQVGASKLILGRHASKLTNPNPTPTPTPNPIKVGASKPGLGRHAERQLVLNLRTLTLSTYLDPG